ncbi:MAG TPA: OB-fold domain-containing protein [Acidimicrobiales bacterium]|nr:OB-fold domain-containing protein [Acidimicrobiales bacterium]
MHGILSWAAYLPYRRLDRTQIAPFVGQGGGKGTRTVAGFDEDSTTMGVEAARLALRGRSSSPSQLLFATTVPAYADKTNATAIHAALQLAGDAPAFDLGLSVRSAVGGLLFGLGAGRASLVIAADVRTGLPGGGEESAGGDAAAAFVTGTDADGTVLAEFLGSAGVTDEFVERWRTPGETRTKVWDEKFSEVSYVPLGVRAWNTALETAGLTASDVAAAAVVAPLQRVARAIGGKLDGVHVIDDLASSVGNAGAAQPGLLLAALLEQAEPGQVLALVVLADGADVLLFRATDALGAYRPARTVAEQVGAGALLPYGKFLAWRGILPVEPPRRPEPQRVSATAAARSEDWKFAFVGSKERDTGVVHVPPARVSRDGTHTDAMDPAPLADARGTIVTFTVDRIAYSPSPPIVFAVVDFDGGGRVPIELTDADADEIEIGQRVEMTFRRLFTADGIVNYFWKGRLVRDG